MTSEALAELGPVDVTPLHQLILLTGEVHMQATIARDCAQGIRSRDPARAIEKLRRIKALVAGVPDLVDSS